MPLVRNRRSTHSMRSVSIAVEALPQQVLRVFDGNGKVRAAKIPEHRKIYADHFSVAVEERSARTAQCGGGVVDNFVLEHVPDVALRGLAARARTGAADSVRYVSQLR